MGKIGIVQEWKKLASQEGQREGRREGRLEEKRDDLLLVLREHLRVEVPEDLAQIIRQTTDLSLLSRWLVAAVRSSSLDAFRTLMQPAGPSNP